MVKRTKKNTAVKKSARLCLSLRERGEEVDALRSEGEGNHIETLSPVLHFLKGTVRGCQHLPFNSFSCSQADRRIFFLFTFTLTLKNSLSSPLEGVTAVL